MPPPVYYHVTTTVDELRPYAPEAFENVTEDGLNKCRSFMRNLCEHGHGYRMGPAKWRFLVARFYGASPMTLDHVIHQNEIALAADLEGIKVSSDGRLRLRIKGGVKAREAIRAGQWHVPVFDEMRELGEQ